MMDTAIQVLLEEWDMYNEAKRSAFTEPGFLNCDAGGLVAVNKRLAEIEEDIWTAKNLRQCIDVILKERRKGDAPSEDGGE